MNTDERKTLEDEVVSVLSEWQGYRIFMEFLAEFQDLQVFLAGGVIRDVLLGRAVKPRDFDFFVPKKYVDLMLPNLQKNGQLEIGPFGSPRWCPRAEEPYCDIVPIEQFDVGLGRCYNIIDVLKQFDFTGNAVAFDLRNRSFIDPLNGTCDLSSRVMRAVRFDYPAKPFAKGQILTCRAILWFRILHYATILKLDIEPRTRRWLRQNTDCRAEYELFSKLFLASETGALMHVLKD